MDREDDQLSPTVPSDVTLTMQVESRLDLEELRSRMYACVRGISTWIDLATLDGITVSSDYRKALTDLDRGVELLESGNRLKPTSDGYAVGVAMAATLLRDGKVKSHMFFDYGHIRGIGSDTNSGEFLAAFHALAHECGHVEAAARFDSAFPGVIMRPRPEPWNALDEAKWKYAIDDCWQEYIVCRRVAESPNSAGILSMATLTCSSVSSGTGITKAIAWLGSVLRTGTTGRSSMGCSRYTAT